MLDYCAIPRNNDIVKDFIKKIRIYVYIHKGCSQFINTHYTSIPLIRFTLTARPSGKRGIVIDTFTSVTVTVFVIKVQRQDYTAWDYDCSLLRFCEFANMLKNKLLK